MNTGTGIFWLAVAVVIAAVYEPSEYEFQFLRTVQTGDGAQHQTIRYNTRTGQVKPCIVSYEGKDDPWGSCVISHVE